MKLIDGEISVLGPHAIAQVPGAIDEPGAPRVQPRFDYALPEQNVVGVALLGGARELRGAVIHYPTHRGAGAIEPFLAGAVLVDGVDCGSRLEPIHSARPQD